MIYIFIISITLFFCLSLTCQASSLSGKTVKVAYFDLGDYYQQNKDGTVKSYDADYLDMVSEYTGIHFEYVDCGTWDRAMELLDKHEIDLVGTMQWTMEREEQYEICDASYGYAVAELAAMPDSGFIYEDYEGINGSVVGYIDGYVVEKQLRNFMKEKGVFFHTKTYKTQRELDNALETGKINMVAANAHAVHSDWKIIEKFSYAPFYFASWKGNGELTETISQAIIKINMHQSSFDDNLMKKYFPVMVNSPYNKEEIDCIEKKRCYTVYLDVDTKPIAWYDKENQTMKGILVDVCKQLGQATGLELKICPRQFSDKVDSETEVTYHMLYYDAIRKKEDRTGVTDAILDQKFEMYHRIGDNYEINGSYVIALVKNREGLEDYLKDKYPNCTINEYDSPEECMEKLGKGTVDLVFINTHIAENIIITENLNKFTSVPMTEEIFGIALQFHGEDAQVLSEIVDKGIKLMDQDKINEAMVQYAMNTAPKMTISYMIQQHFVFFVVACILLVFILIVCVSLLIYAKIMRKERNRMEEINLERTDFFARMSHDMRTPMNGILGMLELSSQTLDIQEIQSNTRKAILSGRYMLSLINDTLDLQRLESNKLTLEPQLVSSREFIENLEEMIRPSAEQKQIKFLVYMKEEKEGCYVKIDSVRTKQVFANILSNAVKFTPENGTIITMVESHITANNMLEVFVTISDTGIGMSQDFIQNSLFKPYSQEHNKITNRYAGSGLGLAIVKNLVELMGGTIEVKSEVGEGTTFMIKLEFEYMEEAEAKKDIHSESSSMGEIKDRLEGKKILLCEDHPLNAEIAKRLLESVKCEVEAVTDGEQGVKAFQSSEINYYDAVLMDIRMPVMDGLEAASAIRALNRPDAKRVPIIAMTANAYDSDKENSEKAGMNAHLAKPVDVKELYRTLDRYINENK